MWSFATCSGCYACLQEMRFACSSPEGYRLRVKAAAKKSAPVVDSAWSEEYSFTPTCEGDAVSCYGGN